MRTFLILVLTGVVVWLLIERQRLTDELAAANTRLVEVEKALANNPAAARSMGAGALGSPGALSAPGTNEGRGTWLDAHVERGAKVLQQPPQSQRGVR